MEEGRALTFATKGLFKKWKRVIKAAKGPLKLTAMTLKVTKIPKLVAIVLS